MKVLLIICLIAILLVAFEVRYEPFYMDGTAREPDLKLWEDGSFQVWLLTGCIEFAPCARE